MAHPVVERALCGAKRLGQWFVVFFKWLGSIADPISKWAATLAVVGAGAWAYYQFILGGATDWAINLSLSTEIVRYHDDLALLVVHVRAKNPRTGEVTLAPGVDKYELRVRKMPQDRPSGTVMAPEHGVELVPVINMLPKDGYTFAPGADFDDVTSIVVPFGTVVALTADMDYAGDYVSTSQIVLVQPPGDAVPATRVEQAPPGLRGKSESKPTQAP